METIYTVELRRKNDVVVVVRKTENFDEAKGAYENVLQGLREGQRLTLRSSWQDVLATFWVPPVETRQYMPPATQAV